MSMLLSAVSGKAANASLYEIISARGLTSNLKLCLDVASAACYGGSGQQLTDLSGNGAHFWRGETNSSEATDPTFNGTAGGNSASEYFSFDGGDDLTCQLAVQSWMSALHQNNALFTLIMVIEAVALSTGVHFSTCGGGSDTGVYIGSASDGAKIPATEMHFQVFNAGSLVYNQSLPVRRLIAISVDESANVMNVVADGANSPATCTYSSPSAGAATNTIRIGRGGASATYSVNNTKFNMAALWQGVALSGADLVNLYNDIKAMRPGYGFA